MDEIRRLIKDLDSRLNDLETRMRDVEALGAINREEIGRIIGILERMTGVR